VKYPTFSWSGHDLVLYPRRMTVGQRQKVRAETGCTVPEAMNQLAEAPDIDSVAVLFYAACVQHDVLLSWGEVASSVTADNPIVVGFTDDEGDGSPES